MAEYKVNLPKTNFPMKADLAKREPDILKLWQDIDLYKKLCERNKNKETFVFHDGPPYANGPIHLGHALNKILKDIVVKSKLMSGFNVPYTPGWDCHGLPIELEVEKKFGKAGIKISKEEFIQKCREYAESQVKIQKEAMMRLGILADWENPYKTMDYSYEANIVRALAKIVENGYLIRGFKPVHWCIACGSALAEAEVEYKDKSSPAIDVRFRFVKETMPKVFQDKVVNASVPIWTTTPWTLPANEAVALNPEIDYVLVDIPAFNEALLIAEPLLLSSMQRYGIDNYKIILKCKGKEIEDPKNLEQKCLLQHPFMQKQVPVVVGDHVTMDAGTGAVHTAPVHGKDDFNIAQKYKRKFNLLGENPVGPNGAFLENTAFTKEFPEFIGVAVLKANDAVLELLKKNDNLIHAETLEHSYPHCWRHKIPLIFRATSQWFIDLDKKGRNSEKTLRENAILAIEKVKWMPEYGKERIKKMVENRVDWCVSRQRTWLVPIALFVHKETGQLHPEWQALMEIVADQIEKEGIIYWYKINAQEFLEQFCKDKKNNSVTDYDKVTDTLDVWFDSGVSHFCVVKQKLKQQLPADLYLEAHDQYRGWYQSSLLTSVAMYGEAAYKNVMTHGHTVDANGHKMSKSLGNVVDPQKIISIYGADILRLWTVSIYYYDDTAFSDEILKGVVDVYRMLRNTARYLLGNLNDFNPKKNLLAIDSLLPLDKWAIAKAQSALQQFGPESHFNTYNFFSVYNDLRLFISSFMSNFYLDVIKDRLYTMKENSFGRHSAQTAMFYILEMFVRCLAPILSFTAEEIWQEMKKQFNDGREDSIFFAEKIVIQKIVDEELLVDFTFIKNIRDFVYRELEKLRAEKIIGSNLDAEVIIYCSDVKLLQILNKFIKNSKTESELRFIFITSKVDVFPLVNAPDDAVAFDDRVKIRVSKSANPKCSRCWHHREEVGQNNIYPDLCDRCIDNLDGEGEERFFA